MRNHLLAASLFGLFANGPAFAAAVVIWPVDPVIHAGEQTAALWLENKGKEPVTLQIRSFAWAQDDGADVLSAQDDVVASPPIAEVAPGKRQLVRVIRRAAPAPGTPERAFRLFIDELPNVPVADTATAPTARLAVQMRYSIPLFTYAVGAAPSATGLTARVLVGANGRLLEIRNTGTLHARLSNLRMTVGTQERMVREGLAGYVLPGAVYRIDLPQGSGGAVKVEVNGVAQTIPVAV